MRKKSMSTYFYAALVAMLSLSVVQVHAEKISLSKNSRNFERPPIDITGTVTDVRNAPLAGATVTIKGTKLSTVTDQSGKFSLRGVANDAVLQISFSGYITEEIQAAAGAIKVTLREQINQLTDVVVVGYGTQRKKDLTGAVVQVKASQLENENARSVQDMLRGNAPGLDVGFNASPKGGGDLRVRGRASLTASTTPLIVVDGVIYQGDLSDVNPNDIATMDVLKDASSAAVFGARSANGVILITTKKGKSGKPVVTFNSNYTMNKIARWPGLLSPEEFLNWRSDVIYSMRGYDSTSKPGIKYWAWNPSKLPAGFTVDQWLALGNQVGQDPTTVWLNRLGGTVGMAPVEIESYKNNTPIDWESLMLNKDGRQHDHTVSVSGRNETFNYYTSFGVFDNEGMAVGERFKTFRARTNIESNIAKYLTIGLNMQFASRDEGAVPVRLSDMIRSTPFGNLYQADGRLRSSTTDNIGNNTNPLIDVYYVKRSIKSNNLFGTVYAKGKLPLGFSYQVNYTPRFEWYNNYQHTSSQRPLLESRRGITSRRDDRTYQWQIDNLLMWNKKFGKHSVDATGLFNAEKFQSFSSTINAENYLPNDNLGWNAIQAARLVTLISADDQYATGDAIMGRINYSYDDKYLLTVTGRRDGYSAFGQGNPRAFFPSAALGWVLSDEKFMSNTQDWLEYAKVRVSYGENGNREIGRYAALSQLSSNSYLYTNTAGSNVGVGTVQTVNMSNPNLKWERNSSLNFGADFSLKGGKISGAIDYYIRQTRDLLVNRALPNVTGFTSVVANLGAIDNSGIELNLNTENMNKANFVWRTSFSIWSNKNKIIKLYGKVPVTDASGNVTYVDQDDQANGWFINRNVNTIWDFNIVGVWKTSEAATAKSFGFNPGDFKLEDVNKDGKFTIDDKVFLGQSVPKVSFNLRNEFTIYKNWDVSFQLYGRFGQLTQFNEATNATLFGGVMFYDRSQFYKVPYWTPENQIDDYARMMSAEGSGIKFNVWRSSSFVRVNNVSIAYTVPKSALSKIKAQGLKLYFNVQNAAVFSQWKYFDPENKFFTPSYGTFGLNLTL
ncbi:MAG: SusC/RagA family TonB-linked outer membrane protein [Chitinophagaceae bacterium]